MKEKIRGYIKTYIYRNDENGYVIAKLETTDQELMTMVGYFPVLNEELLYEFTGEIVEHQKYGKQFKVESYERIEDKSEVGLIRYLSSDSFQGIGPVTAQRIVDLLGQDAVKLILEDESILSPILNQTKRKIFRDTLIMEQATHETFISLFDYGLSNRVASKLYKIYGNETIHKLNEDPFRLMYEVDGFGFVKSMDVAIRLGIEKSDIRAIKAAIIYILEQTAYSDGDLFLNHDEILAKVNKLLNVEVEVDVALDLIIKEGKIILDKDNYALSDIYYAEIDIAKNVLSLSNVTKKALDQDYIAMLLTQISIQKNINYTEKQLEAITRSMINPFTVITGGPGTGKTTLIDGLLNVYATNYKLNLKDPRIGGEIALMAPTGRAAKRMKEILGIDAKTIHSHLGFDFDLSYKYDRFNPLPQKLIIIDEASMIDIFLAKRLFDAISEDSQVIIVGDEDQLPSVGPGYVLGDLISSKQIPVIRLKEIHRQAKDSHIIKLASSINNQSLSNEDLISSEDVIFYKGDINDIKRVILNQIGGAIKKGYDLIEDIQVLIPLYKGDLGIDSMNLAIQKQFNPHFNKGIPMTYGDKTYFKGDKVIQLTNDKDRMIMNGDIGVINHITLNDKDKPIMEIAFDNTIVHYDTSDLDNLNLAYVVSIHKSQGSEYKIVFLPIIRSYLHMLKKELIYTAITRAKEYLLVLGDMNLLQYASNQLSEKRRTKLKERLIELSNNKDLFDNEDEEDDLIDNDNISPYDFM